MPAISPELRTVIWIATGVASFLSTVLLILLGPNLVFLLRKLSPKLRNKCGRPPTKKPISVWLFFYSSTCIAIVGAAIASSAPETVQSVPEAKKLHYLFVVDSSARMAEVFPGENRSGKPFNNRRSIT